VRREATDLLLGARPLVVQFSLFSFFFLALGGFSRATPSRVPIPSTPRRTPSSVEATL